MTTYSISLLTKKTDLHKLDEQYVHVYDNMSIDCVIKCHSSSAALTSGQYYENTWLENSKSSSDGGNKALTIIKVQDARGLRTSLVISGWAQKVMLLYPDNLCCLRFNFFILFIVQTQEGLRVSASGYLCSV